MADDHLDTVKRVLATLAPADQRALYEFLRRRLTGKASTRPARTALVATVKRRSGGGTVTYRQEFVRCGRKGCRCARGEKHGPYTYKYWREDGKLRKAYCGGPGWAQRK